MTVADLTTEPIYAGNKHTLRFTVRDQDNPLSPPKDITGMSARWALAKFKADGTFSKTPILTKNSTSGAQIVITTPVSGLLEVYIAEGDTTALEGDYQFQLELYQTSSFSLIVATGTLSILRNILDP